MATAVNTFEFIPAGERIMYESAFNAITQLELWNFIRDFPDTSFMISRRPEVARIYRRIEELGYELHSGASFGSTLRNMQYIAKYGLEQFEHSYVSNSNSTSSIERSSDSTVSSIVAQ